MKIGYIPNIKAILKKSTIGQGQATARYKIRAIRQKGTESRHLLLDAQTQRDLELFNADEDGMSLFDQYNSTRTQGGKQILRQRMESPFSDYLSITNTQQSISFIAKHREIFSGIGFWITGRVERYQKDPLMFIVPRNRLSFAVGAITMKLLDSHHYFRILRGVQMTCLLIQSLRNFLQQITPLQPAGELTLLCEEISEILHRQEFGMVPEKELTGKNFFRILRLDQTFRIYDKETVQRLLHIVYELDALFSMADATSKRRYILPEILDGPTKITAEGLVHPLVESAVPNDVFLDQNERLLFLTGPNMAGKTTYLKAIATAIYLGHLGMGVPARKCSFTPVDCLFSSISIKDNLHSGTSYFLAEVLRIKSIAKALANNLRVIAVMDEPFKGTNVKDALEASSAIIHRLEAIPDCLFLFSSHLIELDDGFNDGMKIHRAYFEAQETHGKLRFDYSIHSGVSSQRLGMRVLSEQGVLELLDQG